jgi:hypothetical protein
MRLYVTWDSLEFQRAFHTVYWADSTITTPRWRSREASASSGRTCSASTTRSEVLLRRKLIEFDMVDDLLGNSTHAAAVGEGCPDDPRGA